MYKRQPNGPAHKVELMQLIHKVVACIIRHAVTQVFKIAMNFVADNDVCLVTVVDYYVQTVGLYSDVYIESLHSTGLHLSTVSVVSGSGQCVNI